ncbi:MAG: hypothetical protein NC548_02400 [Lachnospiraceae bacterium]|nr:hypothetical protein [Lachnospiraceae bacterium]
MGKLNKFEDVDVTASLEAILKQNTGFYQSDFDIDRQIIAEKAASQNPADKTLLWFCRPSGTHCFRERDVFIKDTAPNNTWRFYKEQSSDPILAYAVELTGVQDGKIKGNLYELDYEKHYERVKDNTVDAGMVTLVYEQGTREQPAGQYFDGYPDPQLGKFEYFETQPKDPEALRFLLREEKHSRDKLTPGDFGAHIEALHNDLIEREARRIVADMKKLPALNSPDKSHFMVELSPVFTRLASTKDTERLFSMLPYKTLSFSALKGQRGTYALIGKDENRDREVRKPRPSVRAQLAQDKKKTAPKKAVTKKKDHGLEV